MDRDEAVAKIMKKYHFDGDDEAIVASALEEAFGAGYKVGYDECLEDEGNADSDDWDDDDDWDLDDDDDDELYVEEME